MKGRYKGISARLTLEEESQLRAFSESHKITLSEALRLAVSRLSEQERREQLSRQVASLALSVDDLNNSTEKNREALRRSFQLLVICICAGHDETFKAQALDALSKIYPESNK